MTLVVVGDLMIDVVARVSGPLARGSDTPAAIRVLGGGSGANVAAWAARLGGRVAFACRAGDDDRGRRAVSELEAAGVRVHAAFDAARPTGTCVVLVEPGGERTMLPDAGANDGPLELPDGVLAAADHVHVTGYALLRDGSRPSALAALERARAAGTSVSVDPSSWALLRPGAIPAVDLLLPNEQEAAVLAGVDDPERAARALAGRAAREVVVKRGAAGAVWSDGERLVGVPAEPVAVVDTTGAGDAFAAGLLTAHLAGAAPRAALAAGCRAAALAVAQPGARPSYD